MIAWCATAAGKRAWIMCGTMTAFMVACGGVATTARETADDAGSAPVDAATATQTESEDAFQPVADAGSDSAEADAGAITREDASSEDASSADGPNDGGPSAGDASFDAGSSSDGGSDGSADAGIDATSSTTEDAGPTIDAGAPDAVDPDPLAHCQTGARDVFYTNVATPGAFQAGAQTFTNLDSTWLAYESPLDIAVNRAAGYGNALEIIMPGGGSLASGQYSLGTASSPGFELAFDGDGCSVVSGTLDVVDSSFFTDDAGVTVPSSLLLSYAVQCAYGAEATIPVEGCVRYALSPSVVGGTIDAGTSDAGDLSPCAAGGYVFYANAEGGYGGLSGPMELTSSQGTWSAGIYGGLLQVDVEDSNMAAWRIIMDTTDFSVGTYTSSGDDHFAPWVQVQVNGAGCSAVPTGSFTIASLDAPYDSDVSSALLGFDLYCAGQGTLRGCVSYGP